MQTLILQIFKVPYFYILLGILLIIILCIMFNKRIKSLLKNIEIENSKTGEIEGKVSMNNVKITDSTVGSIRGR